MHFIKLAGTDLNNGSERQIHISDTAHVVLEETGPKETTVTTMGYKLRVLQSIQDVIKALK